MKLTMLGTGNALVTECCNTCFIIEDNRQLFIVDGGGGNTILHQIKAAGFDWMYVRHIFVTHKHVDHLLGSIILKTRTLLTESGFIQKRACSITAETCLFRMIWK